MTSASSSATINRPPILTTKNATVIKCKSIDASDFIGSINDPENDKILQYGFWDTSNSGGYFTVDGVVQRAGRWITVTSANLKSVKYWGASVAGNESIIVCVYDGKNWSNNITLTVTSVLPPNHVPLLTASDINVTAGQSVAASSMIGAVVDQDQDKITQYGFWDSCSGGGYFVFKGIAQKSGQWINVDSSNLSNIKYQGAAGSSSESISICVYDGKDWSAIKSITAATVIPLQTLSVTGGKSIATAVGVRTIVNITGSAIVTVNGETTVNAGTGSDVISVNAGNVTVNGSAGQITFIGGGTGLQTLNLKGGSTTAQLGFGAATVTIAGVVKATGGTGADLYKLVKDLSIDVVTIYKFKVGVDHLSLMGYKAGTVDVTSIRKDGGGGTAISLSDGTRVSLVGVENTRLDQLFI